MRSIRRVHRHAPDSEIRLHAAGLDQAMRHRLGRADVDVRMAGMKPKAAQTSAIANHGHPQNDLDVLGWPPPAPPRPRLQIGDRAVPRGPELASDVEPRRKLLPSDEGAVLVPRRKQLLIPGMVVPNEFFVVVHVQVAFP